MAMAAAAGTVTTSASPASVAFGDDRVVGEILDANDARRARDDAEAGVDALAMAIAAAGAEAGVDALAMAMAAAAGTVTTSASQGAVAFGDDRVVRELLDADDARRARDDDAEAWGRGRGRRPCDGDGGGGGDGNRHRRCWRRSRSGTTASLGRYSTPTTGHAHTTIKQITRRGG